MKKAFWCENFPDVWKWLGVPKNAGPPWATYLNTSYNSNSPLSTGHLVILALDRLLIYRRCVDRRFWTRDLSLVCIIHSNNEPRVTICDFPKTSLLRDVAVSLHKAVVLCTLSVSRLLHKDAQGKYLPRSISCGWILTQSTRQFWAFAEGVLAERVNTCKDFDCVRPCCLWIQCRQCPLKGK